MTFYTIGGNVFDNACSCSGTTGVFVRSGSVTGVVSGNSFKGGTTSLGVNLGSGSAAANVQANVYSNITTEVLDNGTSDQVGIPTK